MTIEVCDGFVHVSHSRSARDMSEVEEVIEKIDAALDQCSQRRLVFDSRRSDRTPDEIQVRLWNWLVASRPERVATVVTSDMLAVSLKMTGLSKGVKLRAFDDEDTAARWVTK